MAALSRNTDFAVQQSKLSSELSTKIAPTESQDQEQSLSGYHQLEAHTTNYTENSSQYNEMYDSKDNSVYPTGRIHSYPAESDDTASPTYQPKVSKTTDTSYQSSNSSYFQDADSIADRPAQSTAYTDDNSYSQQRYTNSDGSYSSRYSYSNEAGYDRSYRQEASYDERFSDRRPNSYDQSFVSSDGYQSNSQSYPYSNYSRQQQNYSRGNYSYQNPTQGYDSSPDSHPHSGQDRYRQDTPASYVQDYHGDRSYNHDNRYSQPYDSGYDRGTYQSKHEDLRYSKPKISPERGRGRKESNSSDDFVQRRSAILKRAQVHHGGKHSKASRGPQIVQPHRLSDSSDTKKGDKSEFPKRNLDSFKIPKKKSTISASSPIKQSVPIPALNVKEQVKIEFSQTPPSTIAQTSTSYTVVSNTTNKLSNLTEKTDGYSGIETDKALASKPDHAISKPVPPRSTVKKAQSSSSAGKAKTQRSTKANAMPTILSTLDPKTLMSLAVTLQKSIEKV